MKTWGNYLIKPETFLNLTKRAVRNLRIVKCSEQERGSSVTGLISFFNYAPVFGACVDVQSIFASILLVYLVEFDKKTTFEAEDPKVEKAGPMP